VLKIGNISIDMPFFQAAISGYSDRAMRVLARQYGAPLTLTGVMLDKIALHHKAAKKLLFRPGDDEHPVGAQILGSEPKTIAAAAAVFEKMGYDLIDLNFACPAPKVLRRGRGGALLTRPNVVMETYRRVRQAVNCPVIMKLRAGFDSSEAAQEDFWSICRQAAAERVDGLVVHGRTVAQKYRKEANWEIIAEVKRTVGPTLVFGSGDLFDAETAVERFKASGVDGMIIARGAIGNPWIFQELRALYKGGEKGQAPGLLEQGTVMLRHFEMICQIRKTIKAVRYFRKFAVGYCRRHPQRKQVQMALMGAKTGDEVLAVIKQWYGVAPLSASLRTN
jgi:nifR3 family TIM-barrel protein